jgi:hypothetical protein
MHFKQEILLLLLDSTFLLAVAIYFKGFSEQIKSYTKVVLLFLVTGKLRIIQSGNKSKMEIS